MPLFSIILAVYNDWTMLDLCLHSITQQTDRPDFEVIVIDDGSNEGAPEAIRRWADRLPLHITRQPHAGISSARNRGIQLSQASILLFVDADCRLRPSCLTALKSTVSNSPVHNSFQLRIVGDCRGIVGRAEALRLIALQNHLLRPDGRIRYLNTAGFAIRRSYVDIERGLFDARALRAEDTMLLADLIQRDDLPFFATDAIVQHDIPLSLIQCLRKDFRSALLEARTFDLIASKGIRIRMSNRERLELLRSMWAISGQAAIGRLAVLALTIRQSLQRITSFFYTLFRNRYDARTTDLSRETLR